MKKIFVILICFCTFFYTTIGVQATNILGLSIKLDSNANIISDHTTLHHTKEEVIERYLSSLKQYDYTNSMYQEVPILTAPYYEGSLKEEVKQDVLRQYNFYRWLSGLNEVTINEDKMARSQKGALINSVNNVLTHWPTKPSGMSEEFYKEAYDGVNAKHELGDTYSGNASYRTLPYDVVKGYVDDSNNLEPNVGHRSSMLDPYAKQISFGHVENYGAMSVYYDGVNLNDDSFYPWPSAGYVPAEAFPATTHTMWSIWLGDYKTTDNTKVEIAYLGETYEPDQTFVSGKTLYYYVPNVLNEKIVRSNNQYVVDTPIYITISGLQDNTTISYQTTFVQAKEIPLEKVDFLVGTGDGYYYNTREFELGNTYHYWIYLVPEDATIGNIEISMDEPLLSFDQETETFKTIKGGKTTLKLKDRQSGYETSFDITVKAPSTGVRLNETDIVMLLSSTKKLNATLLPEGTTDQVIYIWTSSDFNIVSVDQNGNLKALKKGKATITVTTSNGFQSSCQVIVNDFLKGDVNMDGNIKMNDVILVLRASLNLGTLTKEQFELADMDDNGLIKMNDVIMVLRKSLNL